MLKQQICPLYYMSVRLSIPVIIVFYLLQTCYVKNNLPHQLKNKQHQQIKKLTLGLGILFKGKRLPEDAKYARMWHVT